LVLSSGNRNHRGIDSRSRSAESLNRIMPTPMRPPRHAPCSSASRKLRRAFGFPPDLLEQARVAVRTVPVGCNPARFHALMINSKDIDQRFGFAILFGQRNHSFGQALRKRIERFLFTSFSTGVCVDSPTYDERGSISTPSLRPRATLFVLARTLFPRLLIRSRLRAATPRPLQVQTVRVIAPRILWPLQRVR